ncbi:MAG TPA: hypothetical protein VHG91_21265 [Longimicrobium sp.]|nr:hypothetical protein [Longimicrobium sp.]
MKPDTQAPPVHLLLRSHPPAPARVGLVAKGLPGRLARALASLAFFWGIVPYVVWVPPHYPWPVLCFGLGGFLAHRFWTGRFVVQYFAGVCPRCARPLRVPAGTPISLPHRLTCFGCHFEPELHVYSSDEEEGVAADARGIRHVTPECAGSWREARVWDEPYVACTACGARHHATPAVLDAARVENERGRLLEELADEGRFFV